MKTSSIKYMIFLFIFLILCNIGLSIASMSINKNKNERYDYPNPPFRPYFTSGNEKEDEKEDDKGLFRKWTNVLTTIRFNKNGKGVLRVGDDPKPFDFTYTYDNSSKTGHITMSSQEDMDTTFKLVDDNNLSIYDPGRNADISYIPYREYLAFSLYGKKFMSGKNIKPQVTMEFDKKERKGTVDNHPFTYNLKKYNIPQGEASYQVDIANGGSFNPTFNYKASDPVLSFDKGMVLPNSNVKYDNLYQIDTNKNKVKENYIQNIQNVHNIQNIQSKSFIPKSSSVV